MKYNFDKIIDRKATDSIKWEVSDNELPMWVADMDFDVAPAIKEALLDKINEGVYGYSATLPDYFKAYMRWWKDRHDVDTKLEWYVFSTGVVSTLSSVVKKLTTPAENVLIQGPVYNCFYSSILNAGRNVLSNDLIYENGEYHIDFIDLEEKLANKQTTMMILCNPHNPCGNLWTKEEIKRIGELCIKHHVVLVSDEIHCDVTDPGYSYNSALGVNEILDNLIVCLAPSKMFNIAGLHGSCVVVPNENLRHKVWRGINTDEVGEPNCFVQQAHIAAYTKCDDWADSCNEYIYHNKLYFMDFVKNNLPKLHVVPSHATYLLWVDISKYNMKSTEFCDNLRKNTGLFVNPGIHYGERGDDFFRINLATTLDNVKDACRRLKSFLDNYE